jgi:hypothetical protein
MAQAGLIDAVAADAAGGEDPAEAAPKPLPTEDAIRADERLGAEQKAALIAVYRSMLA